MTRELTVISKDLLRAPSIWNEDRRHRGDAHHRGPLPRAWAASTAGRPRSGPGADPSSMRHGDDEGRRW